MSIHQSTRVLDTPLAAAHAKGGAKLGAWFGCALPDEFGGFSEEYLFARETLALIDKNYRAFFTFIGPDRARFLNAVLTNNTRDLKPSEANVSLLLSPQGRILAEIEAYAMPERILAVSFAMIRESLAATFDELIIMDDVTLTDDTNRLGVLALEGPRSPDLVREICGLELAPLPELGHVETRVGTIPCRVVKRSPGGIPGAEFIAERAQILPLWNFLLERARALGGGPMGYAALSARRLEQGIPWFGYDYDERHIPHEAGLELSHISYTKGCYTGQEIVERVRSRGQVNRLRVGLKFSGREPPAAGAVLLAGDREAGGVTRAAHSPALGSAIGMGYVLRDHSAPGTELTCGGTAAEVILLPVTPVRNGVG
ncbi:MAG: glycine cleavage T C-terminal barrel domain-containing protein [Candidatus Acidiferrales bacterium]|jgi:folate-binding protein YgfZ